MAVRSFDDNLDSAVSPYVEGRFQNIFNRDIMSGKSVYDELRLIHSSEWRDYCGFSSNDKYYGPDFVMLGRRESEWTVACAIEVNWKRNLFGQHSVNHDVVYICGKNTLDIEAYLQGIDFDDPVHNYVGEVVSGVENSIIMTGSEGDMYPVSRAILSNLIHEKPRDDRALAYESMSGTFWVKSLRDQNEYYRKYRVPRGMTFIFTFTCDLGSLLYSSIDNISKFDMASKEVNGSGSKVGLDWFFMVPLDNLGRTWNADDILHYLNRGCTTYVPIPVDIDNRICHVYGEDVYSSQCPEDYSRHINGLKFPMDYENSDYYNKIKSEARDLFSTSNGDFFKGYKSSQVSINLMGISAEEMESFFSD